MVNGEWWLHPWTESEAEHKKKPAHSSSTTSASTIGWILLGGVVGIVLLVILIRSVRGRKKLARLRGGSLASLASGPSMPLLDGTGFDNNQVGPDRLGTIE